MFATTQLTVEQMILTHIPGYTIHKIDGVNIIFFSPNDIVFNQAALNSFWRACNAYHLNPVAKTFLGRIRAIKFHEA
jgi:hypothetical protein